MAAHTQFTWIYTHADPYFPLDSIEDDLGVVFPDREGNLRPVVALVRVREGINDYRYTLALARAIEKASAGTDEAHRKTAGQAKQYLDRVLQRISFQDTDKDRRPQMMQEQLEEYRAKFQDFLVKLSEP